MSQATVKHAVDTWVNQVLPTQNYKTKLRMTLRTQASNNKYGFIHFNRPWPTGATIISAKLRLYAAEAWAGSNTITVQRPNAKWGINRINYNNMPGVVAGTATLTQSGTADGALYEVDVTTLVQAVASGAPWYGFRIAHSSTADVHIHSAQSSNGDKRPTLFVVWSDAPDEPDNLRPAGGRSVSPGKQWLSWTFSDVSGDQNLAAVQVQFGASEAALNAGTATFDTGTVASSEPELDLSTTAFVATVNGATSWWRCRNQDGAGLWSPWADAVSYVSTTKGVLTITSPTTGIQDGSPTVTWTFTGQTQRAYQVILAKASAPKEWIYDSGKVTSTSLSHNIPFRTIIDASVNYIVTVRVWDTITREAIPNDTVYVEASTASIPISYGATAAVTGLTATPDLLRPKMDLNFSRSSAPDQFQLQRSSDGGVTWRYIDEALPSEITAGGTAYTWTDPTAAQYVQYQWRVIAVVGGVGSNSAPTVSGIVARLCPVLMRKDATDACFFMNPERDRQRFNVQGLHERMTGPPVLVTQRVGGQGGHVRGRFVSEAPGGAYTPAVQKASFLSMEADSGQRMVLSIANETLEVVAYNFNIDTITDSGGVTYVAEFDWVEFPS
jgi:hypothetical protein